MKTVLVSAVALIDRDGRVLLAQRPAGKSMAGLWEFPGGKREPGETFEDCLPQVGRHPTRARRAGFGVVPRQSFIVISDACGGYPPDPDIAGLALEAHFCNHKR